MVDLNSFRRLLFGTLRRVGVGTILADAGYDTESNHRFARDGCGVRSVIPPLLGRPTEKLPSTEYRRLMKRYRDHRYGQRWQAETVASMIKQNLGSVVGARSDQARSAEAMLKVLTHNVMLIVVFFMTLFYRASSDPLIRTRPGLRGRTYRSRRRDMLLMVLTQTSRSSLVILDRFYTEPSQPI